MLLRHLAWLVETTPLPAHPVSLVRLDFIRQSKVVLQIRKATSPSLLRLLGD